MAYSNTIPQATDQLSQSQLQLLNNFMAIQTYLAVNHVTFNTADMGKHVFVEFPLQTMAPTFVAGETGLWNQNFATSTQNETYIRTNFAGGGVDAVPMTASIFGTVAAPATNTNGWTYIPSGFLLKWGFGSFANTINFNTMTNAGPAYTTIVAAFVCSTGGSNGVISNVSGIASPIVSIGISPALAPTANWVCFAIGY